jgi:hypothetical protein
LITKSRVNRKGHGLLFAPLLMEAAVMKKMMMLLLVSALLVSYCVVSARERPGDRPTIVRGFDGARNDLTRPEWGFGVAQSGTTWFGANATGTDVVAGGVWDFDNRGTLTCPNDYIKNGAFSQGWEVGPTFPQDVHWHAEGFTDPQLSCSSGPLGGSYSAWCGVIDADVSQCFQYADAPGYGGMWDQFLCRAFDMPSSGLQISYRYDIDVEWSFDYAYVTIDSLNPDDCGGPDGETLVEYTGTVGGYETLYPSGAYAGRRVRICFGVVTDGAWDDQDGLYPTCDGAFILDNITVSTDSGSDYTDFESGDLEGWTPCVGGVDFTAIRGTDSFINHDPCQFDNCEMEGCVLTFFNPERSGEYGNGGHFPGYVSNTIWSQPIDLTGYPDRNYVISYDLYGELKITNGIFIRHAVRYAQDPNCPTGVWSQSISDNQLFYWGNDPLCRRRTWAPSGLIPADADSVIIGIGVVNWCEGMGLTCTEGNETPILDNIRLGTWEASAPQASINDTDNYCDSFAEDPRWMVAPGLIDVANNLGGSDFIRLGDTLVVSLADADAYAELCFKVVPGYLADLSDDFFTTWFPSGNWSRCEDDPAYNLFQCARMDTAFYAGNGIPGDFCEYQRVSSGKYASTFHEDDPRYAVVGGEGVEIFPDSLFTQGTKIYYYIRTSYLPGPGPYACVPYWADENDLSTLFEVEVLPDVCKYPAECLLYVDYYNRGAQSLIEDALTSLGRTWDRFDLRAETSGEGNGIGNRYLGAGKYRLRGPIGPSYAHLEPYEIVMLNNGTFGERENISDGGMDIPWDPSDDVTFLQNALDGFDIKGLWLSGNNIASDFAHASSGPKPSFLSNTLGAQLISSSYRDLVGHPTASGPGACREVMTRYGEAASDNYYDTFGSLRLTGSACPQLYDFDVIDESEMGGGYGGFGLLWDRTDLINPPDGYCASVDHIIGYGSGSTDTVRTKIDGFSMHLLRCQCGSCPGSAPTAMWIRDVLGGTDSLGYFRYWATGENMCPPQGTETLDVPGGPYHNHANVLYQNYPNPFRVASGTTIQYSVAEEGRVEIRFFDVAGRLIDTIEGSAEAGENRLSWKGTDRNGNPVPAGVYFYEIRGGGFVDQKKMLVIR